MSETSADTSPTGSSGAGGGIGVGQAVLSLASASRILASAAASFRPSSPAAASSIRSASSTKPRLS